MSTMLRERQDENYFNELHVGAHCLRSALDLVFSRHQNTGQTHNKRAVT